MVSDPIADMLTRIRNGLMARHESTVMPASRMKLYLAKILKQEGFIANYETVGSRPKRELKIVLRYDENGRPVISGLVRVSKPGLRIYVPRDEVPRVFGGLGVAIVSTPKGVMTGSQAWHQGVGGELICKVW